jgi:nucleoside-diphosphate-sugar epimerase
MNILLTGYTGNLGPSIAERLAPHAVFALVRSLDAAPVMGHVRLVEGSLERLPIELANHIEVIVHAAADTSFVVPLETLRATNVQGTERLLAFAQQCPRLRKFIHVSTTCVCGTSGGRIPEAPLLLPPAFVNYYEQSKWEAEERVRASGLPFEIIRLSIVAGSEVDGSVRRMGALHHALYWFYKGLIPMIPGRDGAKVDLISTEYASQTVVERALADGPLKEVVHGCAGASAPGLSDLLDRLVAVFSERSDAWRHGRIAKPLIVDSGTFALFERSVEQSGDVLFTRVSRDSRAFLPGLLHPREYVASSVPEADAWKPLLDSVTRHVLDSRS